MSGVASVAAVVAMLSFATVEAGLFGWAAGTYWQLDAIRWYVTRLVPAALAVHVAAVAVVLAAGRAPGLDTYLVGMLLGLIVGLPAVALATEPLQRRFARRLAAKPADLRSLEAPPEERVHAALDPERVWARRRIDAEEGDVPPRRLSPPNADDPRQG